MASRTSSGSAKPLFAQVPPLPFTLHIPHQESAHTQSTRQGFTPGSTSQLRDGVQQPQVAGKNKHGKLVPCLGEDAMGETQEDCQVNTRTPHAGIHRILYHVVHLFIDLANAVAERDRYPFQRECIT